MSKIICKISRLSGRPTVYMFGTDQMVLTFKKFGTDSHELCKRLPELLGHEAVEDEVDGGVDERHDVHEVAHRVVAVHEELEAVHGGEDTHDSLREEQKMILSN